VTIAIVVAVAIATLAAGGLLTDIGPWYLNLRKPAWKPPDWLFAPAWTTIFICAGTGTVLAWRGAPDHDGQLLVAVLMIANCVFNVLWSLLFFKLRRPDWALIEVVFLWLSILIPMIVLAPFSPWLPWLLAPYLVWVSFASALNAAYVRLNAPFGAVSTSRVHLP
jgi:tryptophan-rich sensory protein